MKWIFWLLPALALAQPDARELLRQSGDAMRQYKSYRLESVVAIDMKGGPLNESLEMPSSVAVRRPDHMRIESSSKAGQVLIVADGEHTWFYISPVKKYVKRAAVESPEAAVVSSGLLPKNLPDLNQFIKSVKLTGEDTIVVGGADTPCWVIQTIYNTIELAEQEVTISDAVQLSWISKDRKLTMQSSFGGKVRLPGVSENVDMTQSTRTTKVALNVDLPDSLFVFTPPEGAKETADWTLPGVTRPDVVGKPAPALAAKTVDGKDVDLAAFKGKVVLLDFWATWCTPCRTELPGLEKIHAEFGDRGLVVLGATVDEDAAGVAQFLKSARVTYPVVALDRAPAIAGDLSITSFPTVVLIDRDGNIAAYEVGALGEAGLREMLTKVGIGAKQP